MANGFSVTRRRITIAGCVFCAIAVGLLAMGGAQAAMIRSSAQATASVMGGSGGAHKNIIPASQSSSVARKICAECKKEVMNVAYCRRYDAPKGKTAWVKIGYYCPGCGHFIREE